MISHRLKADIFASLCTVVHLSLQFNCIQFSWLTVLRGSMLGTLSSLPTQKISVNCSGTFISTTISVLITSRCIMMLPSLKQYTAMLRPRNILDIGTAEIVCIFVYLVAYFLISFCNLLTFSLAYI